jgi:hypothetical protein
MGLVSKRVHQRKTNRLVAASRATTPLGLDQVLENLRETVASTPARTGLFRSGEKLWLSGTGTGPWLVYYGPPSRKEPKKVVPVWTAHVTVTPASDRTETMVTVEMVRWKTKDGALVDRVEFERFRNRFAELLASADPAYRSLESAS